MQFTTIHPADIEIVDWLQLDNTACVIAGGAALRWWQNQPVGAADIDLFFNSHAAYTKQREIIDNKKPHTANLGPSIINSLSNWFNEAVVTKGDDHSVQLLCDSANATTYRVRMPSGTEYKVQLIKNKYHQTVEDLLNRFDITVAGVATDGVRWWVGPDFIRDQAAGVLRLTKVSENSLKRVIKYMSYGYRITPESWSMLTCDDRVLWSFQDDNEETYHEQ
jgi:hypothetical protein